LKPKICLSFMNPPPSVEYNVTSGAEADTVATPRIYSLKLSTAYVI
jgi:hypothetical protein